MAKNTAKHYCYILRCADDTLYTGYTTDLKRRLTEHNTDDKKGARYTRGRRPCNLVYFEEFDNKNDAMSREWHIKQLSRSDKEKLIETSPIITP